VFPLSLLLGGVTALRRDGWLDNVATVVLMVFNVIPEFVIGLVLLLLFSTTVLHVFPSTSLGGSDPLELVLPVVTLALVTLPYMTRLIRASTIEALESEYVAMARLKGLRARRVLWAHTVPNAIVPAFQGAAVTLAYLSGGIIVVEYLFNYQGIGTLLIQALQTKDIVTIQAAVLLLAVFYVIVNLIADLLTIVVSPRLRTAEA